MPRNPEKRHLAPTLTLDGSQTPLPLHLLLAKQGRDWRGPQRAPPRTKRQCFVQQWETPRSSHCSPGLTTPLPQRAE